MKYNASGKSHVWILLIFLALVTITSPRICRAQGGPPPGYDAQWLISYSQTGSATSSWVNTDHVPHSTNINITYTASRTVSETVTIGNEVVLQLTNPHGYLQGKKSWSIASGFTIAETWTESFDITISPYTSVKLWVAPSYTSLTGTTSVWGTHGYEQYLPTSGTKATTPYLPAHGFTQDSLR